MFTQLLNELGYSASPARLMTGTNARSVIAVEVLIKQNEIAPVRIGLKRSTAAIHWTMTRCGFQKYLSQSLRSGCCQCEHLTRTSGAFNFKGITQIVMKLLQRFNQ